MPFPGTQVIPSGWSAHHMPVTEGAMGATCRVVVGGQGDWSPTEGFIPGDAPVVLYEGTCRVEAQSTQPTNTDAVGQLVTQSRYLVAITARSPKIPAGDSGARVTILSVDENGDPALVGRTLVVSDVGYNSLRWERDLTCIDDATNQPGGA